MVMAVNQLSSRQMIEAILNGDHGPEAQANAVLAEVQRRIRAALATVPLKSGDAGTRVLGGFPIIVTTGGSGP